jgi:riboflavin kinase/FMN adenylyltransferase
VTIGNFDGVHRGHQVLLARTLAAARERGLRATALTFSPHPATFFRGQAPSTFRLTTDDERAGWLRAFGMADVLTHPFDADFAGLSAEAFVHDFLRGQLGAAHVVVGWDFTFGARRSGDADALVRLGAASGMTVEIVPQQTVDGVVASSTRIRQLLRDGDLASVGAMLGHPWRVQGRTAHGAGRGKGIGIPTVNLYPVDRLLPPFGVYATRLTVGDTTWPSISNLGVRPTFEVSDRVSLETMVLAPIDVDLHDIDATVDVVGFIRGEQKFESPEALRAQIGRDVETAHALLRG